MAFDTIINNGSVVTATDTYVADVAIADGKIAAIGKDLPARECHARYLDASGKLVLPGGIDVHTHLDMPFGGTTSADDFETGTRAAAFGGTTTLIDFAIQYKGQPSATGLRHVDEQGLQQGRLRLCVSLHRDRHLRRATFGDERSGARRRDQLQAVHGVSRRVHARRRQHLQSAADDSKNGGLVCMHAENGSAIDVIVQQALAEGKKAPKYHALTRPTTAEAEAYGPRHRAGGDGGRADLHRASELQ